MPNAPQRPTSTTPDPDSTYKVSFQFGPGEPPPFGHARPIAVTVSGSEIGTGRSLRLTLDQDGQIVSAHLYDPEGLTASKLQRSPWARWLTAADAFIRAQRIESEDRGRGIIALVKASDLLDKAQRGKRIRPPVASPKRPGRKGNDAAFYQGVAEEYKAFCKQGSRRPTKDLADCRNVSRSTAAGWVRMARVREFLLPARGNRPG